MTGDPRAPLVPVSWGELIDKITILEIKTERLNAPGAARNAEHELGLLRDAQALGGDAPAELAGLAAELAAINGRLWDIEDEIPSRKPPVIRCGLHLAGALGLSRQRRA